jgi:hypothetical protein
MLRADAMTPIDFLNRSLVRNALCKRQCSLGNLRPLIGTEETQSRHRRDYDHPRGSAKKADREADFFFTDEMELGLWDEMSFNRNGGNLSI